MIVEVARTWDGRAAEPSEVVRLGLEWDADALVIAVDAPFHGDSPPVGTPGSTDRLWEHEVVELFLVGPDAPRRRYTEIELSPHGHWLVLQLEGIRRPLQTGLPLDFEAEIDGDRWRGRARVDRALLPRITAFNAFAIHGSGGDRRYLAAHPVPGPQPDFHRLEHFPPWPGGTS